MLRSLKMFLKGLFGGVIANSLVGAGVGIISYGAISLAITTALAVMRSYVSALGADAFGVLMLMGFGDALSIIGSALLVRAAIASAGIGLGKVSRN